MHKNKNIYHLELDLLEKEKMNNPSWAAFNNKINLNVNASLHEQNNNTQKRI